MRIGNLDGRVVILTTDGAVDVQRASGGRFGPEPQSVYDQWTEFTAWAAADGGAALAEPFDVALLDAPSPSPRQVFGIGLNYRDHAQESGLAVPDYPSVFTKFPSSITGPHGEIELPPGGHTDWEVELVAVIGTTARHVAEADAWGHVAGLTAGQDISERITQMASAPPQFSMGKSFPRFGPTGPWLVTVGEFARPDDLELGCAINGEEVQKSRTSYLIISVPQLIAKLSAVLPLLPGDLIFTGTPAGVGLGRSPQRWLAPGDELTTWIEGIGEMRHRFVAG
ncbi:MAG TPA: fumarylacetoacetate hydrolase family protein [Streptosporangiaceae bacterium]|nr:fumarylacetoacetate hydrolase family protein [Streptosporangiaceae bacterium]